MRFSRQFALIFFVLFAALASAQTSAPPLTTSQLILPISTQLAPVTSAVVTVVGNPGPQTYCYWGVANYLVGATSPTFLGCLRSAPNTLSGTNYVQIVPVYPNGALVDMLRTNGQTPPTGACNCAVATGVASGVVNDQSSSLSAYTVAPFIPNNFTLTIANEVTALGATHAILRQGGIFVADLSLSGGGIITGATTNGGLTLTGTTLGLLSTCTPSQLLQWNGAAWACANPGVGTITGSGTTDSIPIWTGSAALGNSPLSVSGGVVSSADPVSVAGSVTASSFIGVGSFLVASGLPGSNFSPSATGASEIAIQADGNLYFSQGNNSSTPSTAFAPFPVVSGTPSVSQIALWVDALHVKGIAGLTSDNSGNLTANSFTTANMVQGSILNATSGFQINGVGLSSQNGLSDAAQIVRYNNPGTFSQIQNFGALCTQWNGTGTGTFNLCPPVTATAFNLTLPNNLPAARTVAVTTNADGTIAIDNLSDGAAVVENDAVNTGTAAMTLDMSASTTANALKIPSQAGLTSNGTSSIAYDTTAKLTHIPTNGADSTAVAETSTSTTTTQALFATAVAGIYAPRAIAASDAGLGNVTNDAQTKAAIVPNTAPSAGQVLVGNAGGTAYAPVSMTQDCTITSAGVITCIKTNNVAFTGLATAAIPLTVPNGGTGVATCPSTGLVLGNGTSPLSCITTVKVVSGKVSLYNNLGTVGSGVTPVYGNISSTGLVAAVTTATLCAAAVCTGGQYNVDIYLDSTVTCATPGTAAVGINMTWTDEIGAKTTISIPLDVNGGVTLLSTMALGNTTNSANGRTSIWSSGAQPIQYATTYTGCTSGTGTYALRIGLTQVQ